MVIYAAILFAGAAPLLLCGFLVYRGTTGLIHSYHQTRVKDKAGYAKAIAKALMGMSIPLVAAGIIGLFDAGILPTLVLLLGLTVAFIFLVRVQKRYNGGVF